jgi:hypothetical protein
MVLPDCDSEISKASHRRDWLLMFELFFILNSHHLAINYNEQLCVARFKNYKECCVINSFKESNLSLQIKLWVHLLSAVAIEPEYFKVRAATYSNEAFANFNYEINWFYRYT